KEPVSAYLRRVAAALGGSLVFVWDQFEEFFVNFKSPGEREPFIECVTACYHAADLPVKFLFSIRSDFLYLINAAFSGRIAEPLQSARLFHLRQFDEAQAADIIARLAQAAHLPLEASLIRKIARDLSVNGAVLPSELQIVGEQLQNKRLYTRHDYLRVGGKE
ncbi:MAG: hypothetical protein ONA90_05585, partial [candidate division KSB1 bacterium]|nr:hypothetical protein [candidate division KSB1 bacterium]